MHWYTPARRPVQNDVPPEVKAAWLQCQEVKAQQRRVRVGAPRRKARAYPFSRLTVCGRCGGRYTGKPASRRHGPEVRRLGHAHPVCPLRPHSVPVDHLATQFQEGVLPYLTLGAGWKEVIFRALRQENSNAGHEQERVRLEHVLANLRKQHLWGHVTDEKYRAEYQVVERHLKALEPPPTMAHLPNVERTAQLLNDMPALWQHPGVNNEQRQRYVQELFDEIRLDGRELVAVKPKPTYAPHFAYLTMAKAFSITTARVHSPRQIFLSPSLRHAASD